MNIEGAPLPTAETTVFKSGEAIIASELITEFVAESPNSKTFNKIARFCEDGRKRKILFKQVMERAGDAINNLEETDSVLRLGRYQDIAKRLNKRYPVVGPVGTSQSSVKDMIGQRTIVDSIQLERSKVEIPQQSIDLANEILQKSFPSLFGTRIPVLKREDIYVVTEDSFTTYFTGVDEVHSERADIIETIKDGESARTERRTDALTLFPVNGRPIVFADKLVKTDLESGILGVAHLARMLAHESLHRSCEGKIVNDVEGFKRLLPLAVADYLRIWTSASESPVLSDKFRQMLLRANEHEPFILIDGALVMIYSSDDKDGYWRDLLGSGYDLTEAVVEGLMEKPVEEIKKWIRKQIIPNPVVEGFLKMLEPNSGASMLYRNVFAQTPKYLENLGLWTDDIAEALFDGKIPYLHLEKLPGKKYGT